MSKRKPQNLKLARNIAKNLVLERIKAGFRDFTKKRLNKT